MMIFPTTLLAVDNENGPDATDIDVKRLSMPNTKRPLTKVATDNEDMMPLTNNSANYVIYHRQ